MPPKYTLTIETDNLATLCAALGVTVPVATPSYDVVDDGGTRIMVAAETPATVPPPAPVAIVASDVVPGVVPTTAATAAPAYTPPPAVDSAGLPWDGRIHSSSRALNKDGTWRIQRNVDKSLIATVEAELRAKAAPVVAVPSAAPAPIPVPVAPVVAVPSAEPVGDGLDLPPHLVRTGPAPVAVPGGPVPTPVPTAPPAITYETVVAMMTDAITAGKITPPLDAAFWAKFGVTGVQQLQSNPGALQLAYAYLAML